MLDAILLIGINYSGTSAALRGCHNDVDFMQRFLTGTVTAAATDAVRAPVAPPPWLRVLKDDPSLPPDQQPTRANIVHALRELADLPTARNIYIHFSGHGGTMPDMNGDEDDGMDSSLVPVDYKRAGFIADDELRLLLNRFRSEQTVVFVGDCCHSGTLCDLPVRVETKAPPPASATGRRADLRDFVVRQRPYPETAARVIMLSGCRDAQTSSDAMLPTPWLGDTIRPIRFGRAVAPSAARRHVITLPAEAAGGAHAMLPMPLFQHVSQHIRAARGTAAGKEAKDDAVPVPHPRPSRVRVHTVVVIHRRRRRRTSDDGRRKGGDAGHGARRPKRMPQGALTSSLLQVLKDMTEQAQAAPGPAQLQDGHWAGLLTRLHGLLQRRRFPQQPQLSFGRRVDAHLFQALDGILLR